MSTMAERAGGVVSIPQIEARVFRDRVRDIFQVLASEPTLDVFDTLPKSVRLLDLFSGTGAGVVAVERRLGASGRFLSRAVAVDEFGPIGSWASVRSIYLRSGYSPGRAETEFNLSILGISCPSVSVVPADARSFVEGLGESPHLPFDLVTGFSLPVHGEVPEGVSDVLDIVPVFRQFLRLQENHVIKWIICERVWKNLGFPSDGQFTKSLRVWGILTGIAGC